MILIYTVMDSTSLIIGYTASLCLVFGYLPQAIHTIRARDTDGISLPGFTMLTLGSVGFFIQGVLLGNPPLWISNLITAVSSFIVFYIKLRNDYRKRHPGSKP